jgi:endonuclease G, mitochondrial
MKKQFIFVLVLCFFCLLSSVYSQNKNIELGMPTDSDPNDEYIIQRSQYVVSFCPDKHVANWVSWNLNKKWFGKVKRYNKFIADPDLPVRYYQAMNSDYSKTGYDKGHTVRSEERTNTKTNNKTTFYFTNIMPQKPDLNRGVWLKFERYCENLCKKENKELYIIAGGIYHKGYKTIRYNVAVPDSCYKIVVVLNKGEGLKDVSKNTTLIAVVMPNKNGIRKAKWENYTTTVRKIEWSTGFDFLSNVKKDIQDVIENK